MSEVIHIFVLLLLFGAAGVGSSARVATTLETVAEMAAAPVRRTPAAVVPEDILEMAEKVGGAAAAAADIPATLQPRAPEAEVPAEERVHTTSPAEEAEAESV